MAARTAPGVGLLAMPVVALLTAAMVVVGVYSFIGLNRQERARQQDAGSPH